MAHLYLHADHFFGDKNATCACGRGSVGVSRQSSSLFRHLATSGTGMQRDGRYCDVHQGRDFAEPWLNSLLVYAPLFNRAWEMQVNVWVSKYSVSFSCTATGFRRLGPCIVLLSAAHPMRDVLQWTSESHWNQRFLSNGLWCLEGSKIPYGTPDWATLAPRCIWAGKGV
jgi:hypothetical protein